MKCKMQQKNIADWILGNLSDEAGKYVEEHLKECDQCATTAKQLEQGMHVLTHKATEPLPLGLKERIMSHAQEQKRAKKANWLSWRLTMAATATAIIVVTSLTVFGPEQEWTEQQLYQAYSEDFEDLGLIVDQSSTGTETETGNETGQLFGVPTELVSYLN